MNKNAQMTGLELALGGVLKFSKVYTNVEPHGIDQEIQISDFLKKWWRWLDVPSGSRSEVRAKSRMRAKAAKHHEPLKLINR